MDDERSRITQRVVTSAPARLDFGGGWTDVPPYADREGGTVCNVAITRRTVVALGSAAAGSAAGGAAGGLVRGALRRAGIGEGAVRVTT
ncbi:MAG TPA: hypothetical protein VGD56_09555, partial [Gemmatirosa sp.]